MKNHFAAGEKRGHSEFHEIKRRQDPFRAGWRGSGSPGFFGLSRLCDSTSERDKIACAPE